MNITTLGRFATVALLRAVGERVGFSALAAAGVEVPEAPSVTCGLNLLDVDAEELGFVDALAAVRAGGPEAPIHWIGDGHRAALVSGAHLTALLDALAEAAGALRQLGLAATDGTSPEDLLALSHQITGLHTNGR